MIYLDYAASTPVLDKTLDEFLRISKVAWANPSSSHYAGREAKNLLEKSRTNILTALTSNLEQKNFRVIFTSTATEANNLALHGARFENQKIITGSIEHDSILKQVNGLKLGIDKQGKYLFHDLEKLIDNQTRVVSLQLANNEIGVIQNLAEISHLIKQINLHRQVLNRAKNEFKNQPLQNILLHCDASQAPVFLDLNLTKLGIDMLTLSGSKMYAPKGSACLILKKNVNLKTQILGGNQESGFRSGTENVAGNWCLAHNLDLFQRDYSQNSIKTSLLRDWLIENIQSKFPKAILNGFWQKGEWQNRLANNVHFSFPEFDQDTLLTHLDLQGFCVSAGSGCHSGANQKSQVIQILGVDPNWANLRISLGLLTTQTDLEKFLIALQQTPKI